MTAKNHDFLDAFLRTLKNGGEFESLFDHLPEVCFLVKDSQSRLMMGNQTLLKLLRQDSFETVIGRSSSEFLRIPLRLVGSSGSIAVMGVLGEVGGFGKITEGRVLQTTHG